ncbi:MAG: PAS domain S-box protein [Anaerolineae bacterium]
MKSKIAHPENKRSELIASHQFWLITSILILTAFLHYTAQIRLEYLTRHSVERILMVLPVVYAALTFGMVGGIVTLSIAVLIMLPRALFLSPSPADAILETGAVAIVGGLMSWLAEIQRHEKKMRHKALAELEAVAEQLRASENNYRDLFENASDAILVQDMEGHIVAANRALARLTGYDRQELMNMDFTQLLSEEDRAIVEELQSKCFIGQEIEQPYELRLRRKDGSEAIIELGARCIFSNGQSTGLQYIIRDVTEQRRLNENMRFYIKQITKAQEEERKRIARELHDDTAQALIALSRRLDALDIFREQLPEPAIQRLEDLHKLSENALQNVRRFIQDLRPPVLDDLGLLPALEGLVSELTAQDELGAEFKVEGESRRLSPEAELILYRIIQEALSNIRRHSQASKVAVSVEFYDTRVRITVNDNGKGFEQPDKLGDLAAMGKLGLLGMHERARLLNGTLTIRSEPGQGTTVVVDVPA